MINNTIIITNIYKEFWGTNQFRKSCNMINLPVYNAHIGGSFTGNGDVFKNLYKAFIDLQDHYKYAIYSDGADTFFVKAFQPPAGKIIYSAEKACYPIESMAPLFPQTKSPWKYLNGGNYCGEIKLLIEFFDKYGLNKYKGDINGQKEQSESFLKAKLDEFPIELDDQCKYFQSIAFEDPGDFYLDEDGKGIVNNITGSIPCVYHGNGRTDMTPIYKRYNLQ